MQLLGDTASLLPVITVARTWSSGPRAAFTEFCGLPSTTFQAKLYMIGCGDDDSMLVFDPKTGAWTKAAPRPDGDDFGPLSRVVLNGQPRLHMVGGDRPGNNFMFTP